jgi:Pyruvate/2-oxoacid:ferredoxin oxidoreductase gamma subunit
MTAVFPLGVKKDVPAPDAWRWRTPDFDPGALLAAIGVDGEPPARFCSGYPRTPFGNDIGLKLAGSGGDGAQTAAMVIAQAGINEGFDATHIPSYGPESRGGTSYADVRVARDEVISPDVPAPHILVAFNAPSLTRFGPTVLQGGVVVYDASVIREPPPLDSTVRVVGVPCTDIAREVGVARAKNAVALGALQGVTGLLPGESFLTAIRQMLHGKGAGVCAVNEEAFCRGVRAVESGTGATSLGRRSG